VPAFSGVFFSDFVTTSFILSLFEVQAETDETRDENSIPMEKAKYGETEDYREIGSK
jgi:hypothetical protein